MALKRPMTHDVQHQYNYRRESKSDYINYMASVNVWSFDQLRECKSCARAGRSTKANRQDDDVSYLDQQNSDMSRPIRHDSVVENASILNKKVPRRFIGRAYLRDRCILLSSGEGGLVLWTHAGTSRSINFFATNYIRNQLGWRQVGYVRLGKIFDLS